MRNSEHVGRVIKSLRTRRGLTQGQIEQFYGIPRSWLSLVETGRIEKPERERLEKLAVVFEVPPEVLLAPAGYRVAPLPPPPERKPEELLREALTTLERERETRERDRLIDALLAGKSPEEQLALIPEDIRDDVSLSFRRVPSTPRTYERIIEAFVRDWLTEQATENLERLSERQ